MLPIAHGTYDESTKQLTLYRVEESLTFGSVKQRLVY